MFALILTSPSQQLLCSASSNTNVCSSNGMNVGHWAWVGIYITDVVLTWTYHLLALYCIVLYNVCCHGKIYNEPTHADYQPLSIKFALTLSNPARGALSSVCCGAGYSGYFNINSILLCTFVLGMGRSSPISNLENDPTLFCCESNFGKSQSCIMQTLQDPTRTPTVGDLSVTNVLQVGHCGVVADFAAGL